MSREGEKELSPEELCAAAAQLYRRFCPAMKRRALRWVATLEDAEDVVSSCWLSLLRHIPRLMALEEKALAVYILHSVQNCAIDHLRRRKRQAGCADGYPSELPAAAWETACVPTALETEDPAVIVECRDMLCRLLQGLPENQRQVVLLKLEGWSAREIAAELRLSEQSIRVYWRRAVARLRRAAGGGRKRSAADAKRPR